MRIKTEIPLTLSLISEVLNIPIARDAQINAITTDSRDCKQRDLFFALGGERYDGADFIEEAKLKKAFTISERRGSDITVQNTYSALLKLSSYYKSLISPKYTVAVTGSCGKTTVKDFISIILSSSLKTHKTQENYNNIVGLSHTLLTTPISTSALICELGMNHAGEISELSQALRPDIAVITNIGTAHIGNLGSREAIAMAKLEIENGMQGGKTIVFKEEPLLVNAKNPYFVSFMDKNADMYAEIRARSKKGSEIFIKSAEYEYLFCSHLYALHTISSLILAIATATLIGLSAEEINVGVDKIQEANLRQKFLNANGYRIYDDSYNSSPDAVISALNMLKEREDNISALIGDMLELGDKSEKLHEYIGKECAKHGIRKLYAFGKFAKSVAAGAILGGINDKNIFINTDTSRPDITAFQIINSYQGERILVKASHSVRVNRVIDILRKGEF